MLPYRLWFKFVLPVIAWSNFTRYGLFPCRPALMIMLSGSAGFPGHCSLRASPGCPIGIALVLPEEVSHPFCLVGRKHALTRLDTHGRSTLRWIAFSFYHAYSYICLCRTPRRIKSCKPTWFLLLLLELACPKTRRQANLCSSFNIVQKEGWVNPMLKKNYRIHNILTTAFKKA